VFWTTPSEKSFGSMPLGNGDVGLHPSLLVELDLSPAEQFPFCGVINQNT